MPRTAKTAAAKPAARKSAAPKTPEPAVPSLPDGFEVAPSSSGTTVDPAMAKACADAIRAMDPGNEVRTPILFVKDKRHNLPHDYLTEVRNVLGADQTRDGLVLGTRTIKTGDQYRLVFRWRTPTKNHDA